MADEIKELKEWESEEKENELVKLKIPKKRKAKEDCTPEEYEMIYGNPDWIDIKSKQAK